ncbi:TonB-dependent receptor [Hymenobacter sp. H14-R3]|nr:TonB-dependent receptor [Hymenobacter sp. H14-R3]
MLALHLCLASPLVSLAANGSARAQIVLDRKVTVKIESQTIESVLDQLASQLHIKFVYSPKLIGASRRVSLKIADKPLTQVLDELLAPRKIAYEVRNNRVILSQAKPAANVPVSGRVTQPNGEGLPGVTVVVKGTTIGTNTDADGRFTLDVPEGSTLVFSNVGYARQEVPVTGPTSSLAVALKEDQQALSEVVVVGYGTQERQSVTGAVASVSGREISSQPVADPAQAIQGRAAGVQVVSNSGSPGGQGGTSIRVRGITSAGNNSPLYVVDGFPLPAATDGNGNPTGTEINNINPNDIETIDVLKDASATAIYGVRAANGVVLITTKHGKAGTSNINIDVYAGVQNVWRKPTLLNSQQYAELNNEARNNYNAQFPNDTRALNPLFDTPDKIAALPTTNWIDELFRPARIQNYSVGANGGSEKARYAISAGYFQQNGTIIGSDFQRFTLRTNGEIQLTKILKVGNNLSLSHQEERPLANENNEISGPIQLALQAPPFRPAYNPDGSFYEFGSLPNDNFGEENPVTAALRPRNRNNRNRVTTTFYVELEPVKHLRLRTNIGADLQFNQNDQFYPSIPGSSKYQPQGASASSNSNYNPSYLIENTATYSNVFAEKHAVTFLLGQSAQQFDYFYLGGSRTGYATNTLSILDRGPVNSQINNNGGNGQSRLASYFGRLNYEYAGKYLFSAIVRYDGSSAFSYDNKFGVFPGVSAGWRISEEDFLKDNATISNLKLRAGYGKVGNPLNAGTFGYASLINSNPIGTGGQGTGYIFGPGAQTLNTGGVPTRLQNTNLRWENNEQYNVGVDVGFLKNRITASVDIYTRTSPNLLLSKQPSYVSGTSEAIPTNAASSRNRGIDINVTSNNFSSDDNGFTWSTTLNVSAYRSQILSLGGGQPFNGQGIRGGSNITRYDVGQPLGEFYGYVADGLFQTPAELAALNDKSPTGFYQSSGTAPGDIKFKDLNGDGVVNDADRTFIGNPNPKFTYGLNNTFGYKGFDLNVFLQGSQGNDVYNLNRYYQEGGLAAATNAGTIALARWTGEGTSNYVPRAVFNDPNQNIRPSSHYLENGSYLRVKLVTLGYTFPKSVLGILNPQRLRVYVSAQNLLTATKYTGFDPELGNNGQSFGVDRGIYPQARVFLAGVNIGF